MAKIESTLVIPNNHNQLAGLNTGEYLHLNVAEKAKFDNLQLYLDSKVDKNSNIIPGSFSKITYDAKGLVIGGSKAAISDITSLQDALDAKMTGNPLITGGTYTKVAFDSKGLVTAGSNANTSDIPDSSNKRYVLDSDLIKLSNTSGINTGDQNLNYIASLTDGTVELSNGDDAIIPLATEFHAGLLSPPEKALIETAVQPGQLNDIAFSGEVQWSNIFGDINLQTDLQNQFDTKLDKPEGTATQYLDGLGNPKNFPTYQSETVKAAESILKGQAVYISGANGTNILVSKASNSAEHTSSKTMGIAVHDMEINDNGKIAVNGLLAGLDTTAGTIGDPVWLGEDGNLIYGLANKPVAPKHLVYIGTLSRVHATVGEIYINIQNGFEIEELHNVLIEDIQNNDILVYDELTGLWKNEKNNAVSGGNFLIADEFNFTSSQDFTCSGIIVDIFSVSVNGQELSDTQYSFDSNVLTIVDTLENGDYIRVLYSKQSEVGVFPSYTKAEMDSILARDWMSLVRGYSSIPTKLLDLSGGGMIWEYKYNGDAITLYRRIQNGGLDDAFFESLSGTTVSGQIAQKNINYI